MILADQGADVIKVENPAGGDHTRGVSNRHGGFSASFLNNNRNKRSVALNLKHPRGVEVLMKLAAGADVFVQNFRPGVVERMGVDYDAIRAVAPDIVYVSISGFGERGPYAAKPVYDPLVQALSGLTTIQGGADEARPRLVRTILPDKLTGFTGSQAITAAAAGPRARRRRPARPALDARFGDLVPVVVRHVEPDLRGNRYRPAGGPELHRPDL